MIDIKRDIQVSEIFFHRFVVLINDCLRRSALFHRLYGDGRTMFIATAHKYHISFLCPQVAGINICRNISTRQVTHMF